MNILGLSLLAGLLLVTDTTPQDFGDLFAMYGNLNKTREQYYSVQYLGSSPEEILSRYNLTQGKFETEHEDVGSGNDGTDYEDDEMEDLFYENGFVVVSNDDVYNYSYKPGRPYAAQQGNESTNGNVFGEILHDDEENSGMEPPIPGTRQNESSNTTASTPTTEAALNESSSSSLEPTSTTALDNETTPATTTASNGEVNESDLQIETNYESTETNSDSADQIIPAFVHPIHRPSNEWPLNATQIGNLNNKLNRKPVRRRRPLRRPQTVKRRRPKPQNGLRRPANSLKKGNKVKGPYRRKRPFRTTDVNSIRQFFTPKSCGTCKCGVTTTRRIVGGTVAAVNEFPWLALIAYNGSIQCGGTLISDRHVLTAAHCVRGFAIKQFQIRFLEYNRLESSDTTLVVRMAARIYTLSSYRASTADNDVAIITLSSKIDFVSTTVRPICLPPSGKRFVGKTGTIAGWGTTTENGSLSKILRKATVPILSNAQCQLVGMNITKNMICAGRLLTGGVDACQGDSGGPLMVVLNKRYYMAGVVSWGDGCARPKKPGVYARVTRYLQWIDRISIGSCTCT